jgi:hypothetical protein
MCAAYPDLRYRTVHRPDDPRTAAQHRYALFDCMIEPESGAYLSEDFTFCRRWTALGGEIWVDGESRLTHTGTIPFQGNLSAKIQTHSSES